MTLDEFWKTLEGLKTDEAAAQLAGRLKKLPAADVAEFELHFIEAFRRAYHWKLWGLPI